MFEIPQDYSNQPTQCASNDSSFSFSTDNSSFESSFTSTETPTIAPISISSGFGFLTTPSMITFT